MHRNDCNNEIVHFPVQIATGENPDEVWHVGCSDMGRPIELICLEDDCKPASCRRSCDRPKRTCDRPCSRKCFDRCRDQYCPMIVPCISSQCNAPCVSRGPANCVCRCRWVAWKFEESGRCPRFVFGRITKACSSKDQGLSFEKVYYAAAFNDCPYLKVTDRGIPPSLLNFDCLDNDNRVFEYQRLQPYPLFILKHVASGQYVRKCDCLLTLGRVENASTWILRR